MYSIQFNRNKKTNFSKITWRIRRESSPGSSWLGEVAGRGGLEWWPPTAAATVGCRRKQPAADQQTSIQHVAAQDIDKGVSSASTRSCCRAEIEDLA
jgi:hypothetical protein